MTAPPCPEIECWEALQAASLPPDQEERWERHLASCTACQIHLQRLEEDERRLLSLARQMGDPTTRPVDPTLTQVRERLYDLTGADRPAAGPSDLYFLRPTDEAGLLGTLGPFEVREVIGQGGMGIVLAAYEPSLHRLVAIKMLSPALAGSATARQRFTREAKAAAAVCHEHVVAVHGVHESDGLPYLVMQYVAGESLQARLDRTGPLEVAEVVRIGMQTASGLAAAHAQGLIHRDIKPANLLLENGLAKVKITDFGLARTADDVGLTRDGTVAGTPEYMAPEQARGEVVDHRADLFSLGSVLYAMCAGVPPFRGATPLALLHEVSEQEPAPVRSLNPDVPEWLEELIRRLLAKDPEQRVQSAAEITALLEGYLAHLQQPATVDAPRLRPPPRRAKRRPSPGVVLHGVRKSVKPLLGLALAVLAVAAVLPARLWFGAGDDPPKQAREAGPAQPSRGRLAIDFRAGIENVPGLSLDGPGDLDDVARTDAQGLRVTFPGGERDPKPVTVVLDRRLGGDLDITVGYEVISVGEPVPQYGAGVVMRVWFDAPSSPTAMISRMRNPGRPPRELFAAHRTLKGPDGNDKYLDNKVMKATRSTGKLRVLRRGTELQYLVADGEGPFTILQSVAMGNNDVRQVQVLCTTMWKPIALDARLTELLIESDQLPGEVQPVSAAAPGEASPGRGTRKWLGALGLAALGFLVLGGVGVWLLRRHDRREAGRLACAPAAERQAEPEAAALSFPCTGCGKNLRARTELAGRKVKCPGCGQPVFVPGIRAG
jgi:serine/threonine protein kinase